LPEFFGKDESQLRQLAEVCLFQPPFIKLDEVEISLNIFATAATGFLEEMIETRAFCRGIRMAGDHFLVPMFDRIGRILRAVLNDPIEDFSVVIKTIGDFFEVVAIELKESEKMFVESNRLVVVAVEQTFAMQPGFVDQTRQMNIAAKFFVGTARSQLLHEAIYVAGRGRARLTDPSGGSDTAGLSFASNSVCCKACLPTAT